MGRRGRAGADDGEAKRDRQHREDAVYDREPGHEVQGDCNATALVVDDSVDRERDGSNAERDGDAADAAVGADGERERR